MITVFYGKDDFSAHEALAALAAGIDADGMLADNTVRVEGKSAKPQELLAICQTVPFLGSHRLVIVTGLLARFDEQRGRRGGRRPKAAESALGEWQQFAEALPALPDTTALVFMETAVAKSNPLLAALPKGARVTEFKALAQAELAGWINARAARYGIDIQARAVAVLAQLVGTNLWLLDSELQKLGTYAAGRAVTEADVRDLVSAAREPSIFAMADAVVEGRVRDALDMIRRLQQESEPPQLLLAMIVRQYRLVMLTRELLAQRARPTEMATRLGVANFVMQRLLRQAPLYSIDSLRKAYRLLLEADLSVKRGVHDDQTALELLVFQLAVLAGNRDPAPGRARAAG